ncbi:hypothetical protein EniLVp02_0092 [Vibrio phage EniLVp02]
MAKFTKTYTVELNDKQREALNSAFKILAEYFVNDRGDDVEVKVEQFDEKRIIAGLIVNGVIFDTKLIGSRGGIRTI